MNKLENLLRLPAPVITLLWIICALPLPWPRTFINGDWRASVLPAYSPALISFLVIFIWMYALHEACLSRTKLTSLRSGRRFWLALAVSGIALLGLSHAAYIWIGSPPTALFVALSAIGFSTVICAFIAMFKASDALAKFEASTTPPDTPQPDNPLLPVLFVGIGIWFLSGRIERMLNHPRLV